MNLKPFQRIPVWVALGVIALVCLVRFYQFDFCERLERMTFDLRTRTALRAPANVATNLGFVFIDEESVKRVWDGSLGYHFGLYWPRQVYGRVVEELAAEGAKAVAFDVLFGELRPDHALVKMADGRFLGSDEFFALQMRRAGNTIIAVTPEVSPPLLFLTNAAAVGDIETDKDSDGILRRVKAFRTYRRWHPAFLQLAEDPDYGVDLHLARIEPGKIVLPRPDLGDIRVPLDASGDFDLADFGGDKLPSGLAHKAKPFTEERVWHMGIVLAARELGLNLSTADVDLPHGRITLHGRGGTERVIPVDSEGYFYIDWCMPEDHPALAEDAIHHLLAQSQRRIEGDTNAIPTRWQGKLVVVGSSGVVGNNLTDRGATPLRSDTLLVSKHWNVANSVITGRFVRRSSLTMDLVLIAVLGLVAAALTWKLRVLTASALVALVWIAYTIVAFALYTRTRYWIPIFLPLSGSLLMTHLCLVTWRVVFEQAERRRLKSIFSTIVSPKIVHELLQVEKLALGGARREVTILFADVRGFTEFTDASQEKVAETVRRQQLTGPSAEACFDAQARETLATINLYLGCVAETVLQQDGTLDKFIGDCVMAFWGAPTPNAKHALACVRAAIDAQRAVYRLNCTREAENRTREAENALRLARGDAPLPPLPVLLLGTGINTGMATVGLMGSEAKAGVRQGNYTVFGREVNLASRLEGLSGRGRIFISQATFEHLQRDDPALATTCLPLPPVSVKGIRTQVCIYEVPWQETAPAQPAAALLEPDSKSELPHDTAGIQLDNSR
ncbi:MAG TPA: adenylate/guanylate cyclase domain-containing protein [Verrucomicrobiae bacterium]|nr:adenylate/guanylate cyclase domain-containing protein [Verrucomicrobiae bacterium]